MDNGLIFTPTNTDNQKKLLEEFGAKSSSDGKKRLFDNTDGVCEHANTSAVDQSNYEREGKA